MIWTDVPFAAVTDWVSGRMDGELPVTYSCPSAHEQAERAAEVADQLGLPTAGRFPRSSGIQLLGQDPVDELLHQAVDIAQALDERRWRRWEDPPPEEQPAGHVEDELVSWIDGVPTLGPGGRLTVQRLRDRRLLLDVVVRPRAGVVETRWRNPESVVDALSPLVRGAPDDARLRAAFGYAEASAYEAQEILRPVFAFLLERSAREGGPGWRVATTIAATDPVDDGPGATGTGSHDDTCV
jgi:hypothetical protein